MGIGIYEDCDCCGEENDCGCCSATPPATITVTFSGITNNGCGTCTAYNSTPYTLTYAGGCLWSGTGECGHTIEAFVFDFGGGSCVWFIDIDSGVEASFSDDLGPRSINCSAGATLTSTTGSSTDCDWTSATATIS